MNAFRIERLNGVVTKTPITAPRTRYYATLAAAQADIANIGINEIVVVGEISAAGTDYDAIINKVYPVGTVYETTDSTFDPAITFGVGTWSLISGTSYKWERTA